MSAAGRRVVIVFDSAERGGAEEYALRASRDLVARGWAVTVAFPSHPATATLRADLLAAGAATRVLALGAHIPLGKLRALHSIASDANRTARLLRAVGPDAVLVMQPSPENAPGAVFGCALTGVPTAVVFHLVSPDKTVSPLRRRLYALARRRQRWIATGPAAAAGVARAFVCEPGTIGVIRNGVDPSPPPAHGSGAAGRAELGIAADAPVLMTVARLANQKGYDVLAEAVAAIVAAHPRTRFVWVGDGDDRAALEARLATAGMREQVILTGFRTDVARLLAAADGFLLPTRYEAGTPFALLEAMAAGVPVIVARSGADPAVIDGEHALVVATGDVDALAAATIRLLGDRALAGRLGAAAARLVEEQFSARAMRDETAALVEALAGARRRNSPNGRGQRRTWAGNIAPVSSALQALAADLHASTREHADSPAVERRLTLLFKLAFTTRLQSVVLLRLAQALHAVAPPLAAPVKWLNVVICGCDVAPQARIGPGLCLYHPNGIVIGPGSVLGANVCLLGCATIGYGAGGEPTLEDDVVVGPGARIFGALTIARGAQVGANAVVTSDVPAVHFVAGVPARVIKRMDGRG